jgi:hypothetical protein
MRSRISSSSRFPTDLLHLLRLWSTRKEIPSFPMSYRCEGRLRTNNHVTPSSTDQIANNRAYSDLISTRCLIWSDLHVIWSGTVMNLSGMNRERVWTWIGSWPASADFLCWERVRRERVCINALGTVGDKAWNQWNHGTSAKPWNEW